MNGSLRADIPASPEGALPDQPVPTDAQVARGSSDYLYNFGSVDALWNGAWGLIRIYGSQKAPDPATVALLNTENKSIDPGTLSTAGTSIFDRLGESPVAATETVEDMTRDLPMGTGGLTCPYPDQGETQRVVEAVIAAVETAYIWPGGTDYGLGRYDPDGLMLALVSPKALVPEGLDAKGWESVTRSDLHAAIKATYARPQPMTLRVHAGDCVRLRFINALKNSNDGLRDELGDARLPPITPLNADPAPTAPAHGESRGELERVDQPFGGLRPSAALGLSVGLPGMDMIRDVPLGYGYGAPALPAASGESLIVSEPFMFYAGRMRLDLPDENAQDALLQQVIDAIAAEISSGPQPWLTDGSDVFPAQGEQGFLTAMPLDEGAAAGLFSLLGVQYGIAIQPQNFDSALANRLSVPVPPIIDASPDSMTALAALVCDGPDPCFDTAAAHQRLLDLAGPIAIEKLDARIHWIPYAFGAVPIRSTSDVISHAQHGLFGAIDVVPLSWEYPARKGPQVETCEVHGRFNYCQASYVKPTSDVMGDGSPALYLADPLPGAPAGTQPERVREFVLYYQDGLNLWDNASRIDWQWSDAQETVTGVRGTDLKMVPDCPVCDDSYDRGDQGVNYRSPAFVQGVSENGTRIEASDDLNVVTFPPDFWINHPNAIRLRACAGEQVVIRVIHPGGRARQRTFVMNGTDYDDLFPGFGFPHSALLAPGKSISAWLSPRIKAGTYLWHDGPTTIRAGGVWGTLDVAEAEQCAYPF